MTLQEKRGMIIREFERFVQEYSVEYTDYNEEVLKGVLALLKAQEPRLVTEADFENADEAGYIPAWYEEKDTGEVYCECISIGALEDAKFGHVRWWTFRPTDEQREAVKWDG